MVGQPLQILNSDPTLHNIHAIPTKNPEFNTGQPIKGMKTDHVFTAAETMVPFKCDVHGWMNAYAGVLVIRISPSPARTARSPSRTCRPAPTS